MSLSLGLDLSLGSRASGGGAAVVPGSSATTFSGSAPTPTVQYHATASSPTVDGNSRVTALTDLRGLANAAAGTTNSSLGGPVLRQDGLSRNYLDFDQNGYLVGATSVGAISNQAHAMFMVARFPRAEGSVMPIWGLGRVDLTTTVNTNGASLNILGSSNQAPVPRASNVAATSAASNKEYMLPGCQLQVIGYASRTVGNGGTRFYHNNVAAAVTGSAPTAGTSGAAAGFEIGRYPNSPSNALNFSSTTNWPKMLVYEWVLFVGTFTDAQLDAIAAALVSNWSIPAITNRLVMNGDSRFQGWNNSPSSTPPVAPYQSIGIKLTEPGGTGVIPTSWSVINFGTNGAKMLSGTVSPTVYRDATNGWPNFPLSGRNVDCMMIGVNDWNTPSTPTDVYNGMVAYYNTVTTGVLQRGWEARPCIEIPLGNATLFPNCDSLRTLMRASQFLTDTGTNTGQTYDGKLKLVDFPLIQVGGVDVCNARTDALNNTYFQTDNIHPTPLLGDLMATDATNGIAARVLA